MLKYVGNQAVSAVKTFRVIKLLHEHRRHYNPPGRLRRMSRQKDELCDGAQVESSSGVTAVLEALRGVTASEDLASFLHTLKPGLVALPRQKLRLLTRLLQDVPCAFTLIDPELGYLVYDILTEWKQDGSGAVTELDLTRDDLTTLILNLQDFGRNETVRLANQRIRWQEVFSIYSDSTKSLASYDVGLGVLDSLKKLFVGNVGGKAIKAVNGEFCREMCGHIIEDEEELDAMPEYNSYRKVERNDFTTGNSDYNPESEYKLSGPGLTGESEGNATETEYDEKSPCRRAAHLVRGVVQRISRYPALLTLVGQASGRLGTQLATAVMEHDLGRVLLLLEREPDLHRALTASVQCGVQVHGESLLFNTSIC